MNLRLVAPLCSGLLAALAVPVQATDIQHIYEVLSANQYLQIVIGTVIMAAVFIGIFYKIGKRHSQRTNVNPVTRYLGMSIAILCLILGTLLLVIDFIVLIEPYMTTYAFAYIVLTFQYYFPELVLGIILVGSAGLLLYLVGFYIMVVLQGSKAMAKDTETYHIQVSSELDPDVSKGRVDTPDLHIVSLRGTQGSHIETEKSVWKQKKAH